MPSVLTPVEFIDLVRRMRERQKTYFRTRNSTVLAEARDLERRVDAALTDNGQQKLLFEEST